MCGKYLFFISLFILFNCSTMLFKNKHHQQTQTCPQPYSHLVNLFTVMCNNIANGTNTTLRDACVGCFQSASDVNNQPSISSITACASTYLTNTNYSTCFNLVQTTTAAAAATGNGIDPRGKRSVPQCVTGYCGFVRCIRSVNANLLISMCYGESSALSNATYPDQQVTIYKNITSCILARSRCSAMNPITGAPQNGRYYSTKTTNKFGKTSTTSTAYFYSLQITSSGELRIIGLPDTVSIQKEFCSNENNLYESNWMSFTC